MDKTDRYNALNAPRPPENSASTFLNAIGNGWMIGTVPFVAAEFYSNISGKKLSRKFHIGSALVTVASCGIGAAFGMKEARQLDQYRDSVSNHIDRISDKLDVANEKIDQLTRALEAKEQAPAAAR